jgi:hypothetical protein
MNWKETYTKVFLKQSETAITPATLSEYSHKWWQNTRNKEEGGLRLTEEGFQFITEVIELQTYEVPYPVDFELTTNTIIWLDKFIDCPYYITKRSIFVTNEKKALELHLFSGDVRKYGLTKALKRQSLDEE